MKHYSKGDSSGDGSKLENSKDVISGKEDTNSTKSEDDLSSKLLKTSSTKNFVDGQEVK